MYFKFFISHVEVVETVYISKPPWNAAGEGGRLGKNC